MFLIQFTFPRISVLINSRKNYFRFLTQNSIPHQFIWLQRTSTSTNYPHRSETSEEELGLAGSPSLLKVGPDYPPFLEAVVIPSMGFTKISERILLHMLWDGIKVGFKKKNSFQAKQSVSDVAMQEPV